MRGAARAECPAKPAELLLVLLQFAELSAAKTALPFRRRRDN
jgi:hypothetical protein